MSNHEEDDLLLELYLKSGIEPAKQQIHFIECADCAGLGKIVLEYNPILNSYNTEKCTTCNGSGIIAIEI